MAIIETKNSYLYKKITLWLKSAENLSKIAQKYCDEKLGNCKKKTENLSETMKNINN